MATTNVAELQKKGASAVALKDMKPKDQVKHMLEQNKHVIAQALPRHMNPERLMRVAITSVTSNPKLLECYVPTLIGGIIQCSQMGLEPNTVLGHAYLIPFRNSKANRTDAQVVIGYKGLIDLARRSGQITSIAAHAVRQLDTFEYEYGLTEKLRHVPAEGERGEITHFYAVAHMKDGGHAFEVMTAMAVKRIQQGSQGKNNPVWKDYFEEMGRKTVIRRLAKYLPLSVELATAVAMEDTTARGESQNLDGVLDGDYTVKSDEDTGAAGALTNGTGEPSQGNPADDPRTLLEQVKDACTAAAAISDKNVAYLKLDDARFLLQEMADDNRALAVKEIDAAQATIDARE
jgi:recombination protein RecT